MLFYTLYLLASDILRSQTAVERDGIMKELVEHMAKSLVTNPEAVVVSEKETGENLELTLKVAAEDMGKVIGKQGRIAKAMRVVLKAAATKDGKRCSLEID